LRSKVGIRAVALLATAGLAVSGSACGGGGGGSQGISKADYLAKAKQVCLVGNRQLKSATDDVLAKIPPGQKMTDAQISDFVHKTVIPTIKDQVKQLRAIPPPKGEKAHVEQIYDALDKGVQELDKDPSKLTNGSNVFADADTLANKYGISVCSTSS
jgi:microcompartment protein CcmL/EutN